MAVDIDKYIMGSFLSMEFTTIRGAHPLLSKRRKRDLKAFFQSKM
jgi:hypothetical protein